MTRMVSKRVFTVHVMRMGTYRRGCSCGEDDEIKGVHVVRMVN